MELLKLTEENLSRSREELLKYRDALLEVYEGYVLNNGCHSYCGCPLCMVSLHCTGFAPSSVCGKCIYAGKGEGRCYKRSMVSIPNSNSGFNTPITRVTRMREITEWLIQIDGALNPDNTPLRKTKLRYKKLTAKKVNAYNVEERIEWTGALLEVYKNYTKNIGEHLRNTCPLCVKAANCVGIDVHLAVSGDKESIYRQCEACIYAGAGRHVAPAQRNCEGMWNRLNIWLAPDMCYHRMREITEWIIQLDPELRTFSKNYKPAM